MGGSAGAFGTESNCDLLAGLNILKHSFKFKSAELTN